MSRIMTMSAFLMATATFPATGLGQMEIGDAALVWSDPPDSTIDFGRVEDEFGNADGVRIFELQFDRSVVLDRGNVEAFSTAASAPLIRQIVGSSEHWFVELNEPVAAGETTILSIDGGRMMIYVHSHPGDADGNLVNDERDIAFLEKAIAAAVAYEPHLDINRDGSLDESDVSSLELVLTGKSDSMGWFGVQFVEPPTTVCCCTASGCEQQHGACSPGTSPTTCPCVTAPCGSIGGG